MFADVLLHLQTVVLGWWYFYSIVLHVEGINNTHLYLRYDEHSLSIVALNLLIKKKKGTTGNLKSSLDAKRADSFYPAKIRESVH